MHHHAKVSIVSTYVFHRAVVYNELALALVKDAVELVV